MCLEWIGKKILSSQLLNLQFWQVRQKRQLQKPLQIDSNKFFFYSIHLRRVTCNDDNCCAAFDRRHGGTIQHIGSDFKQNQ